MKRIYEIRRKSACEKISLQREGVYIMEKRAELYALPGEQRRTPCSPWRTEPKSMLSVENRDELYALRHGEHAEISCSKE
jgi:hypothetical protein